MKLYHHTLRRNLQSIMEKGLLAAKSRGKLKAVWLHTTTWKAAACRHMLAKRIGGLADVVCVVVDVPRSRLKRLGGHRGMYYVLQDVEPECIKGLVSYTVEEVSL